MSDINQIAITGRLTRDPELRQAGDRQVLRFAVACGRSWIDRRTGNREDRASYFDCEVWGARAEALARILRKGMQVCVSGSHESDAREAHDERGNLSRRTYWTLRVAEVVLPPRGGQAPAHAPTAPQAPREYDPGLQAAVDSACAGVYDAEIPF